MFESTIALFVAYSLKALRDGAILQSMDEPPRELASEVIERLRQLQFIVERVRILEASADGVRVPDIVYLELRTLTEAFYWVASRTRAVLRSGALPGLESFECVGVRNVRNKLLEHPEGRDSKVFTASFAFGGVNGPHIKAARRVGQEEVFPDAGLYPNAQAFQEEFERLLRVCMEKPGAQLSHPG